MLPKGALIRRNDRCPCGSNKKFKTCCSPASPQRLSSAPLPAKPAQQPYIDSGESAVRWVIVDATGTRLFVDKDGHVLVFSDRVTATQIANLEEFSDQAPGDINVAGVGPTKWQALQEKLPFVEPPDVESAAALVRERIDARRARLAVLEASDEPTEAS